MTAQVKPLDRLLGDQAEASDPNQLVWLSASAGTGKTHVLTARLLRLLLNDVDPATILCLTFTKAAAAEMAERLRARLAHWVRLRESDLRKELFALGEPTDDATLARARTLFARILDAPGGGLRIQTIHAFCQTLLASFALEAGLPPGFKPLDGYQQSALARATLAEMLVAAETGGDQPLIRDVQALSLRLGEERAVKYLLACARAPEEMAALGAGIEPRLRRVLGVPAGDVEAAIAAGCADAAFDVASLRRIAAANRAAGGKLAPGYAATAEAFLRADPAGRASLLDEIVLIGRTKKGDPRKPTRGQTDAEPHYALLCEALAEACQALLDLRAKAAYAALLAAGLRAGAAFSRAYADAKRAAEAVDFDDLIRSAERLLNAPGAGEWVRYKLDRATDHILVDEAQDTNARQWAIVAALADEFFAGEGARPGVTRTIFTVGDHKQAIFGFQGTDPAAFTGARMRFGDRAEEIGQPFFDLALDRSFRSTPPVLAVVDRLLAALGPDALGLDAAALPHLSAREGRGGTVTVWRPHSAEQDAEIEGDEEGWIDDAVRGFASKLARQVRVWLDAPLHLAGQGRPLRPEDVLILVRSRGELASLIVARLQAEGVPVAGVDRLRLAAPLAVRDLIAAIRFALQPEDDLNLANLLVSPLFGLGQDDLFRIAHGRGRQSLFSALRDDAAAAETAAGLLEILASADFTTPYVFLETILSGRLQGRARLLARLGEEALDPIEELLTAALQFEGQVAPSLQIFLDWFDRGDVEITRDPSAPLDAVRVMTVHGAKGLQAPLVILADATANPDTKPSDTVRLDLGEDLAVPMPTPRKAETLDAFEAAVARAARADREEHWRLLYVAATRAEEHLVIGGALGPRAKGQPPAASWYQALDDAVAALGAESTEDPLWAAARHYTIAGSDRPVARIRRRLALPPVVPPAWLHHPAPTEEKPPRPLAPSALGRDDAADPPFPAAMAAAARRGQLLHRLFERLPNLPADARPAAADRWLQSSAGVADALERAMLVRDACAVLADPRFAAIFTPEALAEAPVAAVIGSEVISGTVDRLLVLPDRVLVVDFKTGRRAPARIDEIPEPHLVQIATYAAALGRIFPDRPIEAALLYTAMPVLHRLDATTLAAGLAAWKARLTTPEQSLFAES